MYCGQMRVCESGSAVIDMEISRVEQDALQAVAEIEGWGPVAHPLKVPRSSTQSNHLHTEWSR